MGLAKARDQDVRGPQKKKIPSTGKAEAEGLWVYSQSELQAGIYLPHTPGPQRGVDQQQGRLA